MEDWDINNEAAVKYRVLISDSWVEVSEEAWEAWHGARCLDASDVGGPITYESSPW